MAVKLALLWLLNLFDAVATWYAVMIVGYADEKNPTIRYLIKAGLVPFLVVKVGLVSLVTWLLWRTRDLTLTKKGTTLLVVVFTLLAFWHVFGYFTWRNP